MRLKLKTASISSDTLKHIIGVSGKRNTSAPETVTVRKNNFASPFRFAPGPLQIFRWSGLPWQYFYILFLTLKAASI